MLSISRLGVAGGARRGKAGPVKSRQARRGMVWLVQDRRSEVSQGRQGAARLGQARLGKSRQAWQGKAGHGEAGQVKAGKVTTKGSFFCTNEVLTII